MPRRTRALADRFIHARVRRWTWPTAGLARRLQPWRYRAMRAWDPVADLPWRVGQLTSRAWRRATEKVLPGRATPAREGPPTDSGTRLRRAGVVTVALTGVAAVVAGAVWLGGLDLPDPSGSANPVAVRGGAGGPRPGNSPEGPGLTRPGIQLSVRPDHLGDLHVVERIIAPTPVSVLPLSAPPALPGGAGPSARIVDLQASADGTAVTVADPEPVGGPPDLDLARPATEIELRYRVVDSARRSPSAPPGRVALSLRPAAFEVLPAAPTVVRVRKAVVHTLVCLDVPRERQLCGVDDPAGWHTGPVRGATSHVLALVDLPEQGQP